MSQKDNGKPKESRRGRPTAGRDPVVAVRLPHEAIADVDRLGRTLGLSSRSDAIRYIVVRSTASDRIGWDRERAEIRASHGDALKRESVCFQIEVFRRESGQWRASIRRSDGSKVRVGNMHCDLFITSVDASTADQALQLARNAINAGAVQ